MQEIDTNKVIKSVHDDAAGAVSVFIGTTRDNHNGKQVKSLYFEAYEAMAQKSLQKIARDVASEHKGLQHVSIVHRLGTVPVGEASIAIAVSSPHRAQAMAACQYIIDTLKVSVPIWKRENYVDGSY